MFLKQPEVNPMSHCSHTMEFSSNLVGGNNVSLILVLLGIYFKLKKQQDDATRPSFSALWPTYLIASSEPLVFHRFFTRVLCDGFRAHK